MSCVSGGGGNVSGVGGVVVMVVVVAVCRDSVGACVTERMSQKRVYRGQDGSNRGADMKNIRLPPLAVCGKCAAAWS